MRPGLDGDGVVAVVDDTVLDGDIRRANPNAVGVKGEGRGFRFGINNGVGDCDVFALD